MKNSLVGKKIRLYAGATRTVKERIKHTNIYTDGLKIYTTINYKMQQYAEESVWNMCLQPATSV